MEKHVEIRNSNGLVTDKATVQNSSTSIPAQPNASVRLVAPLNNLANVVREGDDLVLQFTDGSSLRLTSYFAYPPADMAKLFIETPGDGSVWQINLSDSSPTGGTSSPIAFTLSAIGADAASGGSSIANWMGGLVALGAIGGFTAAASNHGYRNNHGDNDANPGVPPIGTAPAAPVVADSNGRTLNGTAEPNNIISIDINGDERSGATVVTDANGNWTYQSPSQIPHGTVVSVTATNGNGLTSPPATTIIDANPPPAPIVDPSDGTVISGEAEPGSTVMIDFNGDGTPDATVQADASGHWTYQSVPPLPDGTIITVTAADAVGNISDPTSVTVDLVSSIPPPVINGILDSAGAITGSLVDGAFTDDRIPVLHGTAAAGATISVFDGGSLIGTTSVDANGTWSFTPSVALAEGAHSFSATARDSAGNDSLVSANFAIIIDTTAPDAPLIDATDGLTLSGTAEAGSQIRLDTNGDGVVDINTTVDASGKWTTTLSVPLTGGTIVTARAVDAAGNISAPANQIVYTGVDITPPAIPVIQTVSDNVGTLQANLANGQATDDAQPTLSGAAEAGATISVFDNGSSIGTAIANASGAWTFTPTTPLAQGNHSFTLSATDAAGNASASSSPFSLTIDTIAPAAPLLIAVTDDVGSARGSIPSGSVSDDTRPTLSGSAEAGATVTISDNGSPIATVIANSSGAWTFTPATALAQGPHSFTFSAADPAGNVGPTSSAFTLTIDSIAPVAPIILSATDDVGSIQGTIANGAASDDALPILAGSAEAGATVTISDNGSPIGTVIANSSGAWTFTPAAHLAQGNHSFSATATDAAGNSSTPSNNLNITIDTTPPPPPTINPSNGTSLTGTAEANATITLDLNGDGTVDTTVTTDALGNWLYTPASALPNNSMIIAIAIDPAGNISAPESAFIDTSIPTLPAIIHIIDDVGSVRGNLANGGFTDDDSPLLNGLSASGAVVSIFDNGSLIGTTVADGAGSWSFTPGAPLSDGTHNFTLSTTDPVGNVMVSATSYAVIIDTIAPLSPSVGTVTDDVGTVRNPVANGGVTDDTLPVLTGSAETGTIVTVYDNGGLLGSVVTNGAGVWSFTPSTPLADGAHSFTLTATDEAGNVGTPSAAYLFTVDTGLPAAPQILSANDDTGSIRGAISDGATIDDRQPVLTGTAEADATITVYDNGTSIGTALADGSGAWSFTPPTLLSNGNHSFTTTATDVAGNLGPASTAFTLIIDTIAPTTPTIALSNGSILNGTAEANATVNIDLNGNGVTDTHVVANTSGNWTYSPTPSIGNGTTVIVTASDVAGNTSAPASVIIDAIAPSTPILTLVSDNVGSVTGAILAGDVTNDDIPTLVGTAEIGATVAVYDNGVLLGRVTVDSNGAWTLSPSAPLAAGGHNITLTASDPSGNISAPSSGFAFTLDLTAPSLPVITSITDDTGSVTGVVTAGGSTNDVAPVLAGTAEAGATIAILDNGIIVGTVLANGLGAWSFSPTLLAEGPHSFTATASDASGNTSGASTPYAIIVDTTPPAAPILAPSDGLIVSGTAEAGATIALEVNGITVVGATAIVDLTGSWSITLSTPLVDNTPVSAIAIDSAGNRSLPDTINVTSGIDATPPSVPVIGTVTDDIGTVQGPLTNGAFTDDSRPVVSGSGVELGATVFLYDNGTLLGSKLVDSSGAWSFTDIAPLSDGTHSFTVTAKDAFGNQSAPSAPFILTIDTVAPAAPTITLSNGASLSGTAEIGATVAIDLNGNGIADASVVANGLGNWSYTPLPALTTGTTVTVTAIDAAGNVSGPASTIIDATAPVVPVITSVTDDIGAILGTLANGAISDDRSPLLSGTAEAGATIAILDNGSAIGTVIANSSGAWTFTPTTPLAQGPHSFTATATDATGNVSAPSIPFSLTIDTTPPAVPVIQTVSDNVGTLQANLANGQATDDAQPTLSGTAEAGATISVFDNGTSIGTAIANASGAWTFTPTTPLAQGNHSFTLSATDAAGNASASSSPFSLTIDTIAPAAPLLIAVTDDVGSARGSIPSGSVSDDTRPTLSGSAEAGATVTISDNGSPIGTVIANSSGAWTFTPATPLAQGPHSFTFSAADPAGNVGPTSSAFTLTVDSIAPVAPIILSATDDVGSIQGTIANGAASDDALPILAGSAEAGATVTISDNGSPIGTVIANSSGAWTFTPATHLAQGNHSFSATATDAAGNSSTPSNTLNITVDTTPPPAPTIVSVTDDVGTRTGLLTNGGATDDTTPLLTGTAEAGATISIYNKGLLIGTTLASVSGGWSFTPASPLVQGDHSFTARATDAVGIQGPASAPFAIQVDNIAPIMPAIISITDDVGSITGLIGYGGITNDSSPLLRGTGEAGTTVSITDNGTLSGTALVDATGQWSFSPTTPLTEGLHSFTVNATDAAGNTSITSGAFLITIDTTPPPVPVITSITDDLAPGVGIIATGGATNDASPLLQGTAGANATVQILDNGVLLASVTANGVGAWSFAPSLLGNGTHNFTAISIDTAGNASAASPAYGIVIDTIAPTATIAITAITQDTGTVGDWITLDTSPTISGTLSNALGTGERVEIRIGSGAWTNATTNGTAWFYGPGTLATGSYTVGVRVVDEVGNIGNAASQLISINSTNQAPVVQSSGTALLGLIGAEALGLLDLSSQALTAFDPNNNLKSVQVRYAPLLSVNLGAFTLTASTALAAELGLQINFNHSNGLLGIIAPSSTLTITAIDGGKISNLAINELLHTVHFEENITLLGLDVLGATTITATDTNNLSSWSAAGTLLDVSLLNANGSTTIQQGNNSANVINGTTANERLYGHGGNDILLGNDGHDLLRGGAGVDSLQGGAGNDILVYDAADVLIDGGTGIDTLLIDSGSGMVLNLHTATNIQNIERIDLGVGDDGRQITLTEAGVLRATDSNHQLVISGDSSDGVTMTGAVHQGQSLISGRAFEHYTLGTTTVFVEDPIMVVV